MSDGEASRLRREELGRYVAYAVWGLGLLALLITFLGVKDKQTVAAQVPYLVSGGLLAVALAALGAALVIVGDRRGNGEVADLAQKLDDLAELVTLEVDLLHREITAVTGSRPAAPSRTSERSPA